MNDVNIRTERFFKLKSGIIFKYNEETMKFYLLNGAEQWVEKPELNSIYYDASSDYYEIPDPLSDLSKEIQDRLWKR